MPVELDISPDELQIVQTILRQHIPQRTVWAFGSRVNGKAKPYSDLDLAVLGDMSLSLAEHADLVDWCFGKRFGVETRIWWIGV
ncbi:nucleotidyltransferase family protein [Kingella kingae]|uniref:nucleotidyltransferase family protein n=1 Tax=Kingella kingae TaxID=504 RepID=UPI0004276AF5|nr:nucleotidyltransferase domain-containing protein [Kingella kingae]